MVSAPTVAEQILTLKVQRRAVILAHHYQDPEIQELADSIGDAMELAQAARTFAGDVIAFCGVRSMAETVKVMNPDRVVVVPDQDAGCSLVDSCPAEGVRAFKRRHPGHVVVSYINTSLEVQSESDIVCTSRNAVAVVNSIPAHRPILFVPDINLGNYVQKQTGRTNMQIWQGACIVHATFPARRLAAARNQHPQALVAAHPECPDGVLRMADFVGSPSAIVDWCAAQTAGEFILVTESGVRYSLEKLAPAKTFYFVANESCNCSECPYMKLNSLEKLLACLETLEPRIQPPVDIMRRARVPLERMLALA
ncbi:MAG TPA: quinolinate synthase NadA [Bryobacteraceae bacterium]|jgi:quinolinate synthase|nr:quinolinate synthase NadA [Bryobacteraceae bacterium]